MGNTIKCTSCRKVLPAKAVFCPWCGKKHQQELTCRNCGTILPAGASFCHLCGSTLSANDNSTADTSVKDIIPTTSGFSGVNSQIIMDPSELRPWTINPKEWGGYWKDGYPWHTSVNGDWVMLHTKHENNKYEYVFKNLSDDTMIPVVGAIDDKYLLIGFNDAGIWMMDYLEGETYKSKENHEGTISEILQFDFKGELIRKISPGKERIRIRYFPYIYGENIFLNIFTSSEYESFAILDLDGNIKTILKDVCIEEIRAKGDYVYFNAKDYKWYRSLWYRCTLSGSNTQSLDNNIKRIYPEINTMICYTENSGNIALEFQPMDLDYDKYDKNSPEHQADHPNWIKLDSYLMDISADRLYKSGFDIYYHYFSPFPFTMSRKEHPATGESGEVSILLYNIYLPCTIKALHPGVSEEDIKKNREQYTDEVELFWNYGGHDPRFLITENYILINYAPGKTRYLPKHFKGCKLPMEKNPEAKELLPGQEYDF